jgi:hypothetical protein
MAYHTHFWKRGTDSKLITMVPLSKTSNSFGIKVIRKLWSLAVRVIRLWIYGYIIWHTTLLFRIM